MENLVNMQPLSPMRVANGNGATSSPSNSPLKPRYGDRFIPARAGNTWHLTYPTSPTNPVTVSTFYRNQKSVKVVILILYVACDVYDGSC